MTAPTGRTDRALAPMARLRTAAVTLGRWGAALARPRRGRRLDHSSRRTARILSATAIACAVIALAMIFVDNPVRLWVKSVSPVSAIFYALSESGRSAWLLVPVGVVIVALANAATIDRISRAVLAALVVRLGFVFIAVGLPGLVDTIVKRWIGRVRPSDLGPFAYEPLSWKSAFASMPSGHATTAFAALVAIGLVLPRLRPLLLIWAVGVAISRVAISAHYVSDVIAGAAVGALGAILVRNYFAARRLGFFVAVDGAVRTMPGPSFGRLRRLARALLGQ